MGGWVRVGGLGLVFEPESTKGSTVGTHPFAADPPPALFLSFLPIDRSHACSFSVDTVPGLVGRWLVGCLRSDLTAHPQPMRPPMRPPLPYCAPCCVPCWCHRMLIIGYPGATNNRAINTMPWSARRPSRGARFRASRPILRSTYTLGPITSARATRPSPAMAPRPRAQQCAATSIFNYYFGTIARGFHFTAWWGAPEGTGAHPRLQ